MFSSKLIGLALSLLIGVTPVSFDDPPSPTPTPTTTTYDGNPITFPLSKSVSVTARVSFNVDDLGAINPQAALQYHNYTVDYTVWVYCNTACQYAGANGEIIDNNTFEIHYYSRVDNKTPSEMLTLLQNVQNGANWSGALTFNNALQSQPINLSVRLHYGTVTIPIMVQAVNYSDFLRAILYRTDELGNLYFAKNYLINTDMSPTDIQTVQNYINNGDYSSAYNYVTNYYVTNSVTNATETQTVVNNYDSKETTLNNLYNTENNFTTQVETDFQNQEQQLPDLNNSIQELQVPKFLQSANWVTAQFNRITTNNAFGSLITFSLLTGFILALIGRLKR